MMGMMIESIVVAIVVGLDHSLRAQRNPTSLLTLSGAA